MREKRKQVGREKPLWAIKKERVRKASRLFRALSHSTRLQIVDLLMREGEMTVSDICERLKMKQGRVSRNLTFLRSVALVTDRRKSIYCFCKINHQASDRRIRILIEVLRDALALERRPRK